MSNRLPSDIIAILCQTVDKSDRLNFITMNKRTLDIALKRVFQPWVWYTIVEKGPGCKGDLVGATRRIVCGCMTSIWPIDVDRHTHLVCGMFTALYDGNLEYYHKWSDFAGDKWDPHYSNDVLVSELLSAQGTTPSKSILFLLEDPKIYRIMVTKCWISLVSYAFGHELVAKRLVKVEEIMNNLKSARGNYTAFRSYLGYLLHYNKDKLDKNAIEIFLRHVKVLDEDFSRIILNTVQPCRVLTKIAVNHITFINHEQFKTLALKCIKSNSTWLIVKIVNQNKLWPRFNNQQLIKFRRIMKTKGPMFHNFEHFFKYDYPTSNQLSKKK